MYSIMNKAKNKTNKQKKTHQNIYIIKTTLMLCSAELWGMLGMQFPFYQGSVISFIQRKMF